MHGLKSWQLPLAYGKYAEAGQCGDFCNTDQNVVAKFLYFLDGFVIY